MTQSSEKKCPHCGAPIHTDAESRVPEISNSVADADGREYDHRGIQLPKRTRVGGIIIPQ